MKKHQSRRSSLSRQVRRSEVLSRAWSKVKSRGLQSASPVIVREIHQFEEKSHLYLGRLARQLCRGQFRFPPATGITLKRQGKEPRPIAVPPVRARVVQRAVLEVLHDQPSVQRHMECRTSFGGVPDGGVRPALEAVLKCIADGCLWYLKTDISDFYSSVPRAEALTALLGEIEDSEFHDLVAAATTVELANMAELGTRATLFPTLDTGLGQGFCLSPLLGNCLLADFDEKLNGRGVVCLRYIDDILFLSRRRQRLEGAFQAASKLLATLGLRLYEPGRSEKAILGRVESGLSYLGCDIRAGSIQPEQEARMRFLKRIDDVLEEGLAAQAKLDSIREARGTVRDVLTRVNRLAAGWGNQYAYCNCPGVFQALDRRIDVSLDRYLSTVGIRTPHMAPVDRRRKLGIHLLAESKYEPIIQPGWSQAA